MIASPHVRPVGPLALVSLVCGLCALLSPGAAQAQLSPTDRAPLDPEVAAHLIVADEGPPGAARTYAIDGRFAGDLDGDGTDDFVLPGATDVLHVVLGDDDLDPDEQDRRTGEGDSVITLPDGCRDGDDRVQWAALGDVDGDGRDDIGVGCVLFDEQVDGVPHLGAVAIYLGRATWPSSITEPDTLILGDPVVLAGDPLVPSDGTRPGADVAALGDLDGDGRAEFVITGFDIVPPPTSPSTPTAWVMPGVEDISTIESVNDSLWRLQGEAEAQCVAPMFAAGLGDIDGDTVPDLGMSCVFEPSDNDTLIQFSVWLGADLTLLPPGDFDFSTRSFRVLPSSALQVYPNDFTPLGDLDGDGFDEFSLSSWADDLSIVSGRIVAGHPAPWSDIDPIDLYWLQEVGELDPYATWLPPGLVDTAEALAMAPAGDLDGDGGIDLWVRSGPVAEPVVGLLTSPRPATWADGELAPFVLTVGTPGGIAVDEDLRFGFGGAGDANGDGVLDLLVTSGFEDGDGCTTELCAAAYLILCVDQDEDGVGVCEGDCDDTDDTVLPGALEVCDELDHDCDGNDGSEDGDGDGVLVCDGDCDDTDGDRFPGAEETCDDTVDLDCDGLIPADDEDGDGAANCDDCQPFLAAMAPGLPETCDGLDNDCDGALPREEQDVDRDGIPACSVDGAPADCDDLNPLVRPGRFEDCVNGVDDNCDGAIDVDVDADGDGVATCDGDCDDTNAEIFPGHQEDCDGLDNNCNGVVDDARDDDGDGFAECDGDCDDRDPLRFPGNVGVCDPDLDADCSGTSDLGDADGDGFSACSGDCAEGDASISPGIPEFCDGIDNDCDGLVDAPFDVDEDSWATCAGDCRDGTPLTYPQITEPVCNDNNDGDCDWLLDPDDPDCEEEATPPPPEPRPYGLSCGSSVAGRGGVAPWLLALLVFGWRSRGRASDRGRSFVPSERVGPRRVLLLLGLAALLALPTLAEAARKEEVLVVYLSAQPDVAAMQESKTAVPKLDAAEILHSSELLPPGEGMLAVGAKKVIPCEGTAPSLGSAVTAALDALIELDYQGTVRVVDKAVAGLPCVDKNVPARLLPNLFYYRGLAKHAMRRPDADADFAKVVALDPSHPADPNFDPAANGRLEAARTASKGAEVPLSIVVLPGQRLRVDGRALEPSVVETPVRPGMHVVQIQAGRTVETIVFEVVDQPVVVVRAADRVRALRDAPVSPGARAYTAVELGEGALTAELDLVALVDLDVAEPLRYFFRPSTGRFSFDADWGVESGGRGRSTASRGTAGGKSKTKSSASQTNQSTAKTTKTTKTSSSGSSSAGMTVTTSGGGKRSARSSGSRTVKADRDGSILRLRVSGGFSFTRPFPYVQIPVDVGIRLVEGLHLDIQIAAANPGKVEGAGPVWLPTASLGASYRFPVAAIEPRVGAAFQIGLDDSGGSIGPLPGWYGLAGFDLVIPDTPVFIGFDVRTGMLGKPFFVGASAGIGVAL